MPDIRPEVLEDAYNIDDHWNQYVRTTTCNYYRVNFVIRKYGQEYRGHVYFHESITRNEYDSFLWQNENLLLDRIRLNHYNNRYEFFNLPSSENETFFPPAGYHRGVVDFDNPSVYVPYIPFEYTTHFDWGYEPESKEKKQKINLELDDKLFEL